MKLLKLEAGLTQHFPVADLCFEDLWSWSSPCCFYYLTDRLHLRYRGCPATTLPPPHLDGGFPLSRRCVDAHVCVFVCETLNPGVSGGRLIGRVLSELICPSLLACCRAKPSFEMEKRRKRRQMTGVRSSRMLPACL